MPDRLVRFVYLGPCFSPAEPSAAVAGTVAALLDEYDEAAGGYFGYRTCPRLSSCLVPVAQAEAFHNAVVPDPNPLVGSADYGWKWDHSVEPVIFRFSYPFAVEDVVIEHVVAFFTGGPAAVYRRPGRFVPAPVRASPSYWKAANAIDSFVKAFG